MTKEAQNHTCVIRLNRNDLLITFYFPVLSRSDLHNVSTNRVWLLVISDT